MRTTIASLLQPTTDVGVLLQLVLVLAAMGAIGWRVRTRADLRLLVVGATVFALGLFVLRAMH